MLCVKYHICGKKMHFDQNVCQIMVMTHDRRHYRNAAYLGILKSRNKIS